MSLFNPVQDEFDYYTKNQLDYQNITEDTFTPEFPDMEFWAKCQTSADCYDDGYWD